MLAVVAVKLAAQHQLELDNTLADYLLDMAADLLSLIKNHSLAFTPGMRYSYSSINYVIVAAMIDRVSGKSYREFIEEKILRPLKLENTFFHQKK